MKYSEKQKNQKWKRRGGSKKSTFNSDSINVICFTGPVDGGEVLANTDSDTVYNLVFKQPLEQLLILEERNLPMRFME